MKKIIVDQEIFNQFPSFKRGVIIVSGINNFAENVEIERLLRNEITTAIQNNNLDTDFLKDWDDVHRHFGSNPNKFPPSIKSLIKRIQKGGELPFINSTVALFNYISIKYLLPCGGDDINMIKGNLMLGFSSGDENFISLGSKAQEHPQKGEVIYFDDQTLNVMCRRWNWRNSDFTKITENSNKLVINIDGVAGASKSLIEAARDELAILLKTYCDASLTCGFLDLEHRELEF